MSGFSGMMTFELKGGVEVGRAVMNAVELAGLAESLGAVETMITHPATMTHADVPIDERRARGSPTVWSGCRSESRTPATSSPIWRRRSRRRDPGMRAADAVRCSRAVSGGRGSGTWH